jgi:hypothetical protein
MKVVINKCYGGFSLTGEALAKILSEWPDAPEGLHGDSDDIRLRSHPALVKMVEDKDEIEGEAFGCCVCTLKVVEVPDGVECQIEEYDGMEWVAEKHRTWGLS